MQGLDGMLAGYCEVVFVKMTGMLSCLVESG